MLSLQNSLKRLLPCETESGNNRIILPKKIPKAAREISAFFYLVIDETIEHLPSTLVSTGIRCFRKGCHGEISSEFDVDKNEIHWKCSQCVNSGTITGIM